MECLNAIAMQMVPNNLRDICTSKGGATSVEKSLHIRTCFPDKVPRTKSEVLSSGRRHKDSCICNSRWQILTFGLYRRLGASAFCEQVSGPNLTPYRILNINQGTEYFTTRKLVFRPSVSALNRVALWYVLG